MGTTQENIDQEQEEVLLIIETNAVVNPRAVMVHSGNASLASRAMMAQWNFNRVTLRAFLGED